MFFRLIFLAVFPRDSHWANHRVGSPDMGRCARERWWGGDEVEKRYGATCVERGGGQAQRLRPRTCIFGHAEALLHYMLPGLQVLWAVGRHERVHSISLQLSSLMEPRATPCSWCVLYPFPLILPAVRAKLGASDGLTSTLDGQDWMLYDSVQYDVRCARLPCK